MCAGLPSTRVPSQERPCPLSLPALARAASGKRAVPSFDAHAGTSQPGDPEAPSCQLEGN